MNRSLALRRKKAEARTRDRKLFLEGKVRKEEISLAAALGPEACRGRLILDRVHIPDDEEEEPIT